VGRHHQPVLPLGVQEFAFRHSVAEAALGLMPTFTDSALSRRFGGQVELVRSHDGVKTPIEPGRRQHFGRTQTAANDNQLAWTFIAFPEGCYGA
jgi:hypothetical protein